MIRRVTRISIWQAAKFCAVLYFLLGLVFAIPFALFAPAESGFGPGLALAIPFIYAIGALIFVPIGCLIFNFVSKLVGGLEFEVVEQDASPA
jgi:hypothetical protein